MWAILRSVVSSLARAAARTAGEMWWMIVLWRVKMLSVFRRRFSVSSNVVRMVSTRSELRSVSPASRDSSRAAAWARLSRETSARLRLLPEMSRWRSLRSVA